IRGRAYDLEALDREGGLLAVLPVDGGTRRARARLEELPGRVVDRFIEAEDRRFFLHPGVDPLAVARAAAQRVSAGRVVSGGSTITMQLARMVAPRGRGLGGKVLEAIDALKLETRLGKRGILELYLSNIPYGRGAEGVESAARAYFGKRAAELGDYEAALLAVIPRSPSRYDPAVHPEELADAALRVFSRGPLGKDIEPEALRAAFRSAASGSRRGTYPNRAPHFVRDALLPALAAERRTGAPPAEPFRARSSIAPGIQAALEAALRDGIAGWEDSRLTNAAGLVLDARTGEILAWAGSVDFLDEEGKGQIDGVLARNQPGSCLKPFLYALALDRGFTPATILPDLPLEFGASAVYIPLNFNNRFNGPVRLRVALASSLNVPAVHVLNRLGVRSFADSLAGLGFASIADQREEVGVGLALGNAGVTLLELTRAFAVFVRGGRTLETTPFALARRGGPAPRPAKAVETPPKGPPAMTPFAAEAIRSILSDPASRFAGFGEGKAFDVGYDAIFKTGTANQYQHVWALGATGEHVVGVWMGNFKGETIIGRTGSGLPARAAARVLDAISEQGKRFPPDSTAGKARICALSGGLATEACPAATDELFRDGEIPAPCDWHRPEGGEPRFPPEYASWLASGGRFGTAAADPAKASILRPADGAVFWFDTAKRAVDQAIVVQVTSLGAPGVQVLHDGEPLTEGAAGRFLVPVARGVHEISLVVDGIAAERVRYEVR
ncbi:MAG: transglycosylase domain-containing protein, partial [Spirochaetaceae bacterium]|nr:transglycosylase domain-containing protein [Spirochaetaceae bacterium]